MRVGFGVHLKGILMILPDLEQRVGCRISGSGLFRILGRGCFRQMNDRCRVLWL